MHFGAPNMNLYFCNPGPYQVRVNININQNQRTGVQYNYPSETGMYHYQQQPTQEQYPAVDYNCPTQPGYYQPFPTPVPSQHLPRSDSSASFLPDSSYSSNLSTPGIASDSWCYNSPQHSFMSPGGRAANKDFKSDFNTSRLSADKTISNFDPVSRNGKFPSTSTPNKNGCFSLMNCTVV